MKALVVGGDGLLGRALVDLLGRRAHDVIRTTRRTSQSGAMYLDLLNPPLSIALPTVDVVYLVAACTGFAKCELEPLMTWKVNADAPIRLAKKALAQDAFPVFVSSDAVEYAGNTAYGRQKMFVEATLGALNCAILRPSRFSGGQVKDVAEYLMQIGVSRWPGLYRWTDGLIDPSLDRLKVAS